jgi:subtilisin family serine protease
MTRWGLLGLLAVVASAGCDDNRPYCLTGEAGGLAAPERLPPVRTEEGREPFLVRYRSGGRVRPAAIERLGGQVTARFRLVPAVAARLTPEERAALEQDPDVEAIEPDVELRALGVPVSVGSVEEYTPALRQVQAPQVWDANEDGLLDPGAPTGAGIRVCVLDSGLDARHPELKVPYVAGHDFLDGDEEPSDHAEEGWGLGHGTHVAGVLAAQLASGGKPLPGMGPHGMVGVAPGVELLIGRVVDVEERTHASLLLSAVEWCQQHGARIITLSLGSPQRLGRTLEEGLQAAADAGVLLIAAAGNDSGEGFEAPLSYPAAYPSMLAVGAVDGQEQVASFSNRGESLSLVAPGVEVASSVNLQAVTAPTLEAGGQTYTTRSLYFASAGDFTGELVDCGLGEFDGCDRDTCEPFIAYVRLLPGNSPSHLALTAMRQGARAILFGVNESMSESWEIELEGPGFEWVPTVAVGQEDHAALLKHLGKPVHLRLESVDYARFSGTSMAVPHVAGAAALVWSARPTLTAAEVRGLLESTAKDLGPAGHDARHGHGLVQARAALGALQAPP